MKSIIYVVALMAIIVLVSAYLPVEYFVSDAFRPQPDKVLTPEGVKTVAGTPMWLYTWRVTVVMTILLFAAIVATFFVKPNARIRRTLAALSIVTAVFHYLTLLFTSSPPGYGVSIYPLFYVINVKGAEQWYLDIGQVLMAYAVYNIYLVERGKKALL
ncbi:hypothetical protein PYWP30_00764 [Pyrobaculum sp. WP30]|nr:hypothetical protein PYWP30_00764 [Pyrobaculum sp. WP30]